MKTGKFTVEQIIKILKENEFDDFYKLQNCFYAGMISGKTKCKF